MVLGSRLAVLLLCGLALGQAPLSYLHGALLDRSSVIVRAEMERSAGGSSQDFGVVPFRVRSVFRGHAPDRILVRTPTARLSGVPELPKFLFLRGLESGAIFDLVDLLDITTDDEEIVPGLLVRYLAMQASDPTQHRQDVRRSLAWVGLESVSVFGRRVGLRELNELVREAPHRMVAADADRFAKLLPRLPKEDEALATRLDADLQNAAFGDFAPLLASARDPALKQAWGEVVERWKRSAEETERLTILSDLATKRGAKAAGFFSGALSDSSPAVRARAAYWIGELGEPESLDGLVRGFPGVAGVEALMRVEAIGKVGNPEAVGFLRAKLSRPELLEETLTALARIGGPEAEILLQGVQGRLRGGSGESSLVKRIDELLDPKFAKEESKRRLRARKTYYAQ